MKLFKFELPKISYKFHIYNSASQFHLLFIYFFCIYFFQTEINFTNARLSFLNHFFDVFFSLLFILMKYSFFF